MNICMLHDKQVHHIGFGHVSKAPISLVIRQINIGGTVWDNIVRCNELFI